MPLQNISRIGHLLMSLLHAAFLFLSCYLSSADRLKKTNSYYIYRTFKTKITSLVASIFAILKLKKQDVYV